MTPPAAPPALDADALQRLRELDPSNSGRLLERVLRAFEGSLVRLGPQLAQARAKGDLQTIKHIAHTLKSSSASVGALGLSRLCAEIEAGVRDERFMALGEPLEAMERELELVLQAVRSTLPTASPAP